VDNARELQSGCCSHLCLLVSQVAIGIVVDVERDYEMHYPEPNDYIGKCLLSMWLSTHNVILIYLSNQTARIHVMTG